MSKKLLKKTAAVFSAAALVCLTGCSGTAKDEPAKLPKYFSIHAEMTDGKLNAGADLTRSSDGWLMTVTSPENLKDMQFLLSDAGWTISCDGLSYSAGEGQLPACSPLRMTARALDGCTNEKHSGKLGGLQYEVEFRDGIPSGMTAENGLKVSFSKYKKTAHS